MHSNWVLFSYNGNGTVARVILGATIEQMQEFIASGGNQDDGTEWCFEGMADCQLVQVPHDTMGFGNSTNLVAWNTDEGEQWERICDLPRWHVDYYEYPEGKIIKLSSDPSTDQAIAEMEAEAEREDPDFIDGKKAF